MAATAKNYDLGKAPKRIELLGDKTKRPESAQHIIEFPGGAVEVSRTESGDYWAHIIVNHGWAAGDSTGISSARGDVIDARIDRDYPHGVVGVDDCASITQIAVLIKSTKDGAR